MNAHFHGDGKKRGRYNYKTLKKSLATSSNIDHCVTRHYTCIVPLANFYYAILVVAMFSVHFFVTIAIWKLMAHFFWRYVGDFARVMEASKKYVDECIQR